MRDREKERNIRLPESYVQQTADLVHQRDALGFSCDKIIHLGQLLRQQGRGGCYQLTVAQDDEAGDGQLRRDGNDGQLARYARHIQLITIRHKSNSFLCTARAPPVTGPARPRTTA